MGFRLGLIWGSIPAECLLLSLLIGEMAARELAQLGYDFSSGPWMFARGEECSRNE